MSAFRSGLGTRLSKEATGVRPPLGDRGRSPRGRDATVPMTAGRATAAIPASEGPGTRTPSRAWAGRVMEAAVPSPAPREGRARGRGVPGPRGTEPLGVDGQLR